MLRVIWDKHGNLSNNLFIIMDGRTGHVWITGTSWLSSFFEDNLGDNEENKVWSDEAIEVAIKTDIAALIELWRKLLSSDQSVCYLPIDLHDQGGSALQVTKRKRLYHITQVWSPDVIDGMSSSRFLEKQQRIDWRQETDQRVRINWELAPSSVETGLKWSLAQLEQPVAPLHYGPANVRVH